MAVNGLQALKAYSQAANLGIGGSAAGKDKPGAGGDFAALLGNTLKNVEGSAKASDHQAAAMAAGKADLIDVVTAVAETEVAIESLVSVRDKMIQAYEEIMRMPI